MDKRFTNTAKYTRNGEEVEFNYNENPSLSTLVDIIDSIVYGIINEVVGYNPIFYAYYLTLMLMDKITDIEVSDNFFENAEFIDEARLYDIIPKLLPEETIEAIHNSVLDKVEFEKQMMANKSPLDDFIRTLTRIAEKFENYFENTNIDDLTSNLKQITDSVKSVGSKELIEGILAFEQKNSDNE